MTLRVCGSTSLSCVLVLVLTWGGRWYQGAEIIAASLGPELTHLDLRGNSIENEGAIAVGR